MTFSEDDLRQRLRALSPTLMPTGAADAVLETVNTRRRRRTIGAVAAASAVSILMVGTAASTFSDRSAVTPSATQPGPSDQTDDATSAPDCLNPHPFQGGTIDIYIDPKPKTPEQATRDFAKIIPVKPAEIVIVNGETDNFATGYILHPVNKETLYQLSLKDQGAWIVQSITSCAELRETAR